MKNHFPLGSVFLIIFFVSSCSTVRQNKKTIDTNSHSVVSNSAKSKALLEKLFLLDYGYSEENVYRFEKKELTLEDIMAARDPFGKPAKNIFLDGSGAIVGLDLSSWFEIPKGFFTFNQLKYLKIKRFQFDFAEYNLTSQEIQSLQNLELLDISLSPLSKFPDAISQLNKLKSLSITSSNLSEIPSEISNLENLETISFNRNELFELPKSIGRLKNLKSLSIERNDLVSLPKEIGELANLEYLFLSKNSLEKIPNEIHRLSKLVKLILSNNQLKELPEDMTRITTLKELHLDNNYLTHLPSSLGNLSNLSYLSCNGNTNLSQLPKSISKMKNLKYLWLKETAVKEVPSDLNLVN